MNGSLAVIGYTQGINVLLNIFFDPAVNAARGIAVQVQNVTRQFCTNFQMALNHQLTKSYTSGDYSHIHQLLKISSNFFSYLMLLISLDGVNSPTLYIDTKNVLTQNNYLDCNSECVEELPFLLAATRWRMSARPITQSCPLAGFRDIPF